jgi:hypothetical protein
LTHGLLVVRRRQWQMPRPSYVFPLRLAMNWQSDRPAWHALCAAAAVLVVFGAAGGELGPATPAQVTPTVHAARRCPHCGWIESKRELLPSAADPRAARNYEYTLRMADGSSSVFQEALPASWRLGERLMVIDGPLN